VILFICTKPVCLMLSDPAIMASNVPASLRDELSIPSIQPNDHDSNY
jgi:hypothetical protein